MYAACTLKKAYFKDTLQQKTYSYSKSSGYSHSKTFGRLVKIVKVNNTYSYAQISGYDSSTESNFTDTYTPEWTVYITLNGSTWTSIGSVCESSISPNVICYGIELSNGNTYDSISSSTTVSYEYVDSVETDETDYNRIEYLADANVGVFDGKHVCFEVKQQ